ncbi:PTS mannose/fructose/sorbose/N-acetylgalactosamine transporter subunit IIC [Companilactobacillus kimchiensis]|uniref:PTS system, mannose-specific IIC component n=1 Tax=Companilactobacillus kimchiensis TaxID=993692 RepID=A0A0R2LL84_9LACO|nr:PTS mannose/fructose/sorbose/N-acetylgalactosamine transporter subunit IIC [Companilactobacillus kimchiensis]KRN98932.1 PTS system, mannose-specific IIC component [Companilactobacillus kimchiensis]
MQALLLGIIAFVAQLDYATGDSMISRPIVTGVAVGLVMGDLKAGIIMGATLELAFIGMFSVGASIPPKVITGGILGVAFAISSHAATSAALILALPIATLALILKNLYLGIFIPYLSNKAGKYADDGDANGVQRMHYIAGFGLALMLAIVVAASFSVGSNAVKLLLNLIPTFVQHGLTVATGIIPALGFAMLAQVIMTKSVVPYFFLGFALFAYLKIPLTGIAIFGAILAVIMVQIMRSHKTAKVAINNTNENISESGSENNDDDF